MVYTVEVVYSVVDEELETLDDAADDTVELPAEDVETTVPEALVVVIAGEDEVVAGVVDGVVAGVVAGEVAGTELPDEVAVRE